jgi:hypothetical protein
VIDVAVAGLISVTGTQRACQLLSKPRATCYHRLRPRLARPPCVAAMAMAWPALRGRTVDPDLPGRLNGTTRGCRARRRCI